MATLPQLQAWLDRPDGVAAGQERRKRQKLKVDAVTQSPEQYQESVEKSEHHWIVKEIGELQDVLKSGKKPSRDDVIKLDRLYGAFGEHLTDCDNLPDESVAVIARSELPILFVGICKQLNVVPEDAEFDSSQWYATLIELQAAAMTAVEDATPSKGTTSGSKRKERRPQRKPAKLKWCVAWYVKIHRADNNPSDTAEFLTGNRGDSTVLRFFSAYDAPKKADFIWAKGCLGKELDAVNFHAIDEDFKKLERL